MHFNLFWDRTSHSYIHKKTVVRDEVWMWAEGLSGEGFARRCVNAIIGGTFGLTVHVEAIVVRSLTLRGFEKPYARLG